MNKKKVDNVISISKDIDILKKFINNLKYKKHNTLTLKRYSTVLETVLYESFNPSNEIYNEIVNDFIKLLEIKLIQVEKEL